MNQFKSLVRLSMVLLVLLPFGASCQDQQKETAESLEPIPNWPPRLFFNTDGNWAFNYLTNRDTKDLTVILDALQGTGVDIVTVLVGIDDDLSWRGSKYGELWGRQLPRTGILTTTIPGTRSEAWQCLTWSACTRTWRPSSRTVTIC